MYIQLWQAILNFVTEYYRFVSLYVGKYESTLSLSSKISQLVRVVSNTRVENFNVVVIARLIVRDFEVCNLCLLYIRIRRITYRSEASYVRAEHLILYRGSNGKCVNALPRILHAISRLSLRPNRISFNPLDILAPDIRQIRLFFSVERVGRDTIRRWNCRNRGNTSRCTRHESILLQRGR